MVTFPTPHLRRIAIALAIVGAAQSAVADDLIFSDGFETGDLSQWTSVVELPPEVRLSTNAVTVIESVGTITVNVELINGGPEDVQVDWATRDGTATAGADFSTASGTVTLNNASDSAEIVLSIIDDSTYEMAETLSIVLSGALGARLAEPSTATITIEASDWPPFVFIADGGNYTAEFDAFEQFGFG